MASEVRQPDAFIAYPTNRVVGVLPDSKQAQAAIEALLQAGFARQDIDLLHGEGDLHRPTGGDHRFLSQFQRTLLRTLSDEHNHLHHYIDDVRAGRSVIMVLAKQMEDDKERIKELLANLDQAMTMVSQMIASAGQTRLQQVKNIV